MVSSSEFDSYWPLWPEGTEGEALADIYLNCSFHHLVDLLWGSDSQFQVEADEARGFVEYVSTNWTDNYLELPSLPGGFDWSVDAINSTNEGNGDKLGEYPNMDMSSKMRKVRFHNRGGASLLGQFFKNEELQRCREHIPNKRMVMEACVCTTAPYCDRIRVICRYVIESLNQDTTYLKIEFHIAYVKSISSVTKMFMEKGARGGLQKNFEIFVATLTKFAPLVSLEDAGQVQEIGIHRSTSFRSHAEQETSTRETPVQERIFLIDWKSMVPARMHNFFEQQLPFMAIVPSSKSPINLSSSALSAKAMAHIVCIFIFIMLIRTLLMVIGWFGDLLPLGGPRKGILSPVLSLLDVPDSVGEVLIAALVLEAAHWMMKCLGDFFAGSETADTALVTPAHETSVRAFPEPEGAESRAASLADGSSVSNQDQASISASQIEVPASAAAHEDKELDAVPNKPDVSNEPVDEPSFLDNTVSFLKLGMVTAALGIELAISGLTKNRQSGGREADFHVEDLARPILDDMSIPSKVVEEVFENERLQPFRVR